MEGRRGRGAGARIEHCNAMYCKNWQRPQCAPSTAFARLSSARASLTPICAGTVASTRMSAPRAPRHHASRCFPPLSAVPCLCAPGLGTVPALLCAARLALGLCGCRIRRATRRVALRNRTSMDTSDVHSGENDRAGGGRRARTQGGGVPEPSGVLSLEAELTCTRIALIHRFQFAHSTLNALQTTHRCTTHIDDALVYTRTRR